MRTAFTLIELMIVIAIIAIIAAIAIPNLLESRVTAQEASAAAALRTGILPAEVQFQAGDYCDHDSNGIGTYAVDGIFGSAGAICNPYNALSGGATLGSSISLTLLAPSYQCTGAYASGNGAGSAQGSTIASMGNGAVWPEVSGYCFKTPMTATSPTASSDGTGERVWAVVCFPLDDNQGRRFFAISTPGSIYMSKPSSTAFDGGWNLGGLATSAYGAFGINLTGKPPSASYLPYSR